LRCARPFERRALTYPLLTALVVIGTANHYLFDVLAGVVLWWAADRAMAGLRPESVDLDTVGPSRAGRRRVS